MTVLELLKQSLQCYLFNAIEGNGANPGMCWCIKVVAVSGWTGHPSYSAIRTNIPEFNPKFLGANDPIASGSDFWWDNKTMIPRVQAFNDLIELYSHDGRKDIPFIYDKKL